MVELRWTDDLPTQYGFYWVRAKGMKMGWVDFFHGEGYGPCPESYQYSSGPLQPPLDPSPESELPTLEQVQAAYRNEP